MPGLDKGLHPRGVFAWINGVEVPVFGTMSAGTFGVPVESVSLREEDAPPGVTVLPYSGPLTPGVISIPRSEVPDVLMWEWFVLFRGEWYLVQNERGGKFLIWTRDRKTAESDPVWDGNGHDGWDQWIDAQSAKLRAESAPMGLTKIEP